MTARQYINARGLDIIKSSESFSAVPYLCPAGVWTNGWGHTKGVTKYTPRITIEQAEEYLRQDVASAEVAVSRLVNVDLNSNQYSALTSLIFNIGAGGFQSSTLRQRLNRGDYSGACDQFHRWVFSRGKKLPGLITRRRREAILFTTIIAAPERAQNQNTAQLVQSIRDAQQKIAAGFTQFS